MSATRRTRRRRAPSILDLVTPECILTALAVGAFVFFVALALFQQQGEQDGAQISVEKAMLLPQHHLRHAGKHAPASVESVIAYLSNFIHELQERFAEMKQVRAEEIWRVYHDAVMEKLYPWDQDYLKHMPPRREDGTIFLSIASYRDENCVNTLQKAYAKAKHPENLHVGLVQQNCVVDCLSGVLDEKGRKDPVEPDVDCHQVFCESDLGKPHCDAGRVRALHMDESESLGPYAARYFASKLWYGEQWYMQIDAHMTFAQDWDLSSIAMVRKAPSAKPIISHYPPRETTNFIAAARKPAPRICGASFATNPIENEIIRLAQSQTFDKKLLDVPRFAPFVAAGYFVAHSDFLREAPFDPLLPWIFMGEEIIMSARFWTHGYDIFSPTFSIVGHIYVRRHKPKFWESVNTKSFHKPGRIYVPLSKLVIDRLKYVLGYPENSRNLTIPKSLLSGVETYGMGNERSLEDYYKMVGIDPATKTTNTPQWCTQGKPPPWAWNATSHLYN